MGTVRFTQQATVWARQKSDGRGSVPWAVPVLVRCRNANTRNLGYTTDGRNFDSEEVFYVDTEVKRGDMIKLGDHTLELNPINVGAVEIFDVIDNDLSPNIWKAIA